MIMNNLTIGNKILLKLSSLRIQCWINFSSGSEIVELHIFAHTSSVAYGTAAYIKAVHQNSTSCNLIIGKSKLAPRKNKLVTIP